MDMLVGGESSPAEVSDKIKEILYAKSSSKIDAIRPKIGSAVFGDDGKHARAAVSTNSLPLGVPVEIDAIFEI